MDNKKDASELSAAVPGVPHTTPPPEEQITTEQMRNLSCSSNPAKESATLSFSLKKAQKHFRYQFGSNHPLSLFR